MAHRFFSLAAAFWLALHVGASPANSQTGNQVSGRNVYRNACPFDQVDVSTDARMRDQAFPAADPAVARIVIVEWRIRKGRECEFLSYWSTRATISNRAGLIAEFLSESSHGDRFVVGKQALIQRLGTVMRSGALSVAEHAIGRDRLRKELAQFVFKPGARGRMRLEAARGHDDLVVAAALAIVAADLCKSPQCRDLALNRY